MEILKQFQGLTKADRESWVSSIVSEIDNGEINPLSIHTQVKCLEDMLKELTAHPAYKSAVLDEAGKYGKAFELYNAKFSIREVGVKYDYSQCGDIILNELTEQLDALSEKVKARQKFLQLVPAEGIDIVSDQTGEVSKIYPPSKSSTTSITVTLK